MRTDDWILAALLGAGATAVMDVWLLLLARLGVPVASFALVGRWVGHFRAGRFTHPAIARAAPVRGELALGWLTHYAVGIGYAALLLGIAGPAWAGRPSLPSALAFGLATVAAPWFVMQPAMGAGIAASRTPSPGANRLRSLANHAVFGVGLYLAALCLGGVGR
jgi:hypothetical protein